MPVNFKPVPIQANFQFTLPTTKYENGDPIEQVYVNWSCGLVIWVRPKKKDGVLQEVQRVVVSPFIISEITGRGKIINIDPDGKSVSYEDHLLRDHLRVFCQFN